MYIRTIYFTFTFQYINEENTQYDFSKIQLFNFLKNLSDLVFV